MDSFDKKFKSISDKDNVSIPENFSWDNVKMGINERLDDKDKIHLASNKTFQNVLLTLIAVSLAIILLLLTCHQNGEKAIETESLEWENIASNSFINKETKNKNEAKSSLSELNKTKENHAYESESKEMKETLVDESFLEHKPNLEHLAIQKLDSKKEYLPDDQLILPSDKGKQNSKPEIVYFDALKTIYFRLDERKSEYKMSINPMVYSPKLQKKNRKDYNLSLYGGTSFFRGKFSANPVLEELRNPNLSPILGQSFALSISSEIFDRTNLLGQLRYDNLYEKFEIEFDKVITVLVKDALIKVDSNIITNRKTFYKRDTLVNAVERKHIRHYNNHRLISFGIQIQKDFAISKRWEVLGGMGFDYSYIYRSQGRTIDSQMNIMDFSANEALFKKNHFGLALSIGINYHLNDSFIIGSNIFMQQYLNNWSKEEGLVLRPQVFLFQAGIKYKL